MSGWLFENWHTVGFGITLVFATAAFAVVGAYYWSALSKDNRDSYPYLYLATFMAAYFWIFTLPILGLFCIGRIAYLLRHKRSGGR